METTNKRNASGRPRRSVYRPSEKRALLTPREFSVMLTP